VARDERGFILAAPDAGAVDEAWRSRWVRVSLSHQYL
jgi:hypothetical protein